MTKDIQNDWKERNTPEMAAWRIAVFRRDRFTCNVCKQKGGRLNAHHLFNFSDYPDKRLHIDNGVTLCVPCHYEFHRVYGKGRNTPYQFYAWSAPYKRVTMTP